MRILFMGTGDIGVPALRWLLQSDAYEVTEIVTQPDKPAGRKLKLKASPIKDLAREHHREVLQPPRLRGSELIAEIASQKPDVIVVMAYGQILPRDVLEMPTIACLNLHASLLPRHRGASPIQAAIEAGDTESGVTVLYMAEGLDTGDILLQHKVALDPAETGGTLHAKLARAAPGALENALELLASGRAPRVSQEESLATYAGKLTREHGLLDWSQPASTLQRKIRALNPWPVACTRFRQLSLKIFAAEVLDDYPGEPGEIVAIDHEFFAVAAGDGGALKILEVQLEGKRRMSAGDFLRGNPLQLGSRI